MISLGTGNGSYNVVDNLPMKICVSSETKDIKCQSIKYDTKKI